MLMDVTRHSPDIYSDEDRCFKSDGNQPEDHLERPNHNHGKSEKAHMGRFGKH